MRGRVALVRPLCQGEGLEFQEPLGAEALAGYGRSLGFDCQVFDRQLDARLGRDALAAIRAYDPDYLGFSLMSAGEAPDALQLWQLLKQPGRRCWAGGLFVTTDWARARALFPEDATLIRGEGEGALAALLLGQPLPREPLHPDAWARPSRDRLDQYLGLGGAINLRASRGCGGNCAFCATPGLPGPTHTPRDIPLVVAEMAALAERYPPIFNFVDDDFGPLSRLEALTAALRERGLQAAFSLELRPSQLCQAGLEDLKRWRGAGLCRIFTGLENLDPATLRRWGKPMDTAAVLQALGRCRAAGIETAAGYILWHDQSSPEAALAQMAILREQGLLNPKAALSRLILFPGSRLYQALGNEGPARPMALPPRAAAAYRDLAQLLSPLLPLWVQAAGLLPNACCRQHLAGGDEAERLKKLLAAMDAQCHRAVFQGQVPDISQIREDLHAFCAAGYGS